MNTSDYKIKNIILIGSGNVATHLGNSLLNKGYIIKKVWSRNLKNANILAKKLHSIATDNIKDIKDADLYIVAVRDDAIEQVIKEMEVDNIIHTSGSTSIEVFNKRINNHGVLYPLQIFNKDIKAGNYQIDTYKKKVFVYGIATTKEERVKVINEAKEILDIKDVIASILLVEDLRIQKN